MGRQLKEHVPSFGQSPSRECWGMTLKEADSLQVQPRQQGQQEVERLHMRTDRRDPTLTSPSLTVSQGKPAEAH